MVAATNLTAVGMVSVASNKKQTKKEYNHENENEEGFYPR